MMTFNDIRQMLEKACRYVEKLDGRIVPGNFGTEYGRDVQPGRCYCPIGALECYLKTSKANFDFNYDPFVEGFDSELHGDEVEVHALGWTDDIFRQLFRLGHEYRKQYVKEAA